ncbi:MAG: ParB/RepB/Spo0J family partition protein, partial [Deltaproteobacteria bacterium]|nr:ParB/RepB/Spo0J family partition protein [Deltaproteobacteria bacterium]
KQHGILQPILVKKIPNGYKLIAGERRLRAAKMIGLDKIPCVVIATTTELSERVVQLIENLHRVDLNPIEEASGYECLLKEHGLTHEQLAQLIGKSRAHVTNMIRLLNLDDSVSEMVRQGLISVGHAKIIASLSPVAQRSLAKKVILENLSVRALEDKVKEFEAFEKGVILKRTNGKKLNNSSQTDESLKLISSLLGFPVSLKGNYLRIRIKSHSDISAIVNKIRSRVN